MRKIITKSFTRSLGSLEQIFAFLERIGQNHRLPESLLYAIKVCLEELFVNMVRYQPRSNHPVVIEINIEEKKVAITLVDYDVEPFDVSQPPMVDTTAPLEERKPGGLGIFLVHQLMDKVLYEYHDRISIITLIKNL